MTNEITVLIRAIQHSSTDNWLMLEPYDAPNQFRVIGMGQRLKECLPSDAAKAITDDENPLIATLDSSTGSHASYHCLTLINGDEQVLEPMKVHVAVEILGTEFEFDNEDDEGTKVSPTLRPAHTR